MDPVDEMLLDRSIIEECLPCHMLWVVATGLKLEGIELRPDVWEKLSRGAALPILPAIGNPTRVGRLAKQVDDLVNKILRQFSSATQEHGLYSVAMFVLKLVDEGLLADTTNMGVLVSLLLMQELRESEGGNIVVRESVLKAEASKLLDIVRREGMFPNLQLTAPLNLIVPAGTS